MSNIHTAGAVPSLAPSKYANRAGEFRACSRIARLKQVPRSFCEIIKEPRPSRLEGRVPVKTRRFIERSAESTSSLLACLSVRDDSQGLLETSLAHVPREFFPMNPAVDGFCLVVRQGELAGPEALLEIDV